MSDVYCAKCGEPQEAYSLQKGVYMTGKGDLTIREAERFLAGEGCPSCNYGETCTHCNGTGREERERIACCRSGAAFAWSPLRGDSSGRNGPYFVGRCYIGHEPRVVTVPDDWPLQPPGQLGKGRARGRIIRTVDTRDGPVRELWIGCPTCKGGAELPACAWCGGSGALTVAEDAALRAAESECEASDEDPADILERRKLL